MRSPHWAGAILCLIGLCLLGALVVQRGMVAGPATATVPVGMEPSAIGLDPSVGRALVLNTLGTTVSVLDDRDGALLATRTVGSNGGAHPEQVGVDARTHHGFVLTDDGQVSMLDTRSGALLGAIMMSGTPSAIAIDGATERVFIANADGGTVSVLDARTGMLLHSAPTGAFPEALAVSPTADVALVANQGDDTVSLLDAHNGTLLRTLRVDDAPQALAISDRYRVAYTGGSHGTLTQINLVTGARHAIHLRLPQPGAPVTPLLAVDEARGLLLIGLGARIEERDLRTGISTGILQLPSTITALTVDPRGGAIIATVQGKADARGHLLGNGSLLVVDPSSRRRSIVEAGLDPVALAIDLQHGRAIVADTNLNPDGSVVHLPARTTFIGDISSRLRRWLPNIASGTPAPHATGSVSIVRLPSPA